MIQFFQEDIEFSISETEKFSKWLTHIVDNHAPQDVELNYIFCSDPYLLQLNREYLNHDYLTDIITFPLSDKPLSADIFISIDRVRDNALNQSIVFETELLRVMSHGVLHLVGFNDKTDEEQQKMRQEEDRCIKAFSHFG